MANQKIAKYQLAYNGFVIIFFFNISETVICENVIWLKTLSDISINTLQNKLSLSLYLSYFLSLHHAEVAPASMHHTERAQRRQLG